MKTAQQKKPINPVVQNAHVWLQQILNLYIGKYWHTKNYMHVYVFKCMLCTFIHKYEYVSYYML